MALYAYLSSLSSAQKDIHAAWMGQNSRKGLTFRADRGMIIPSEHRQGIINGLRVFQRRCGKKQDVAEEIGSLAAKLEAEAEA